MAESLRSIVIAFEGGKLLLPSSLVVEVLPSARPLRMENAPPWVVGSILWKSLTTPIISLERLIFRTSPDLAIHSRIVMINALGADPKLRNFGLLALEPPQQIDLQRTDIERLETDEPPLPGVACRVRMNKRQALIPDLSAVESVLGRLMRA